MNTKHVKNTIQMVRMGKGSKGGHKLARGGIALFPHSYSLPLFRNHKIQGDPRHITFYLSFKIKMHAKCKH